MVSTGNIQGNADPVGKLIFKTQLTIWSACDISTPRYGQADKLIDTPATAPNFEPELTSSACYLNQSCRAYFSQPHPYAASGAKSSPNMVYIRIETILTQWTLDFLPGSSVSTLPPPLPSAIPGSQVMGLDRDRA